MYGYAGDSTEAGGRARTPCFIIDPSAARALYHDCAWRPNRSGRASAYAVANSGRRSPAPYADRRMPRPLYAQINLSALQANVARAREKAPGAQVLAVV